jgi:hypothetical protein
MRKRHLRSIMLSLFILFSFFIFSSSGGALAAAPAGEKTGDQVKIGIVPLQSVKELKRASKEYDFVYVILTAEKESDDGIRKTVLAAAQSSDKTTQIGLFEINKQTDGYKKFVRKYNVKKFPAVIAMNGGGEVEMVQGDISQEKLVEAHAKVSGAKKKLRCPMSEGKACDPKACGKEKGK